MSSFRVLLVFPASAGMNLSARTRRRRRYDVPGEDELSMLFDDLDGILSLRVPEREDEPEQAPRRCAARVPREREDEPQKVRVRT
jgi:hypothetical protein